MKSFSTDQNLLMSNLKFHIAELKQKQRIEKINYELNKIERSSNKTSNYTFSDLVKTKKSDSPVSQYNRKKQTTL